MLLVPFRTARRSLVKSTVRWFDRSESVHSSVVSALMGVVVSFPAIKSAISSLANATKTAGAGGGKAGGDGWPLGVLIAGTVGAVALFFGASC